MSRSKRPLARKLLWEGLWVLLGVKQGNHWRARALICTAELSGGSKVFGNPWMEKG